MSHDLLSDVLRTVRLRGALYFVVNGGSSWAAEAPPSRELAAAVMPGAQHVMEYHVLTSGHCWAAIVGEKPVRMSAGDVIVFPHGDAHVMSSAPGMRAPIDAASYVQPSAEKPPFAVNLNGGGGDTNLVCGFLGCDVRPFNPLIATLPRLLHLRANGSNWVGQFMEHAAAESRGKGPGAEALLERMSEMMFVDAMRRYVATLPDESNGWLAGMRDRFVGRALSLMHEEPARQWSVEEIGREVGLSRSALHERFTAMIGQAPMQYLASWRMQVAARQLRDTNSTVASIAQDVGYESEAAFARAFKRAVGAPPSEWRRARVVEGV
jgi:AraC-like DNA-binding protein